MYLPTELEDVSRLIKREEPYSFTEREALAVSENDLPIEINEISDDKEQLSAT